MKLFCSFKSKKESFLIDNLPIKPKLFLSDINNKIDKVQIQKILKKYIPEKTCILICGTEGYQDMVETAVKTQSNNFKVFHW